MDSVCAVRLFCSSPRLLTFVSSANTAEGFPSSNCYCMGMRVGLGSGVRNWWVPFRCFVNPWSDCVEASLLLASRIDSTMYFVRYVHLKC